MTADKSAMLPLSSSTSSSPSNQPSSNNAANDANHSSPAVASLPSTSADRSHPPHLNTSITATTTTTTTTTTTSSSTTSPPLSPDGSSSSPSSTQSTHQIKIKLREIPFFAEINESKLSTLASYFEFRRCEAGELICREGDEANGFSVLVQGQVKVSASGPGGGQVTMNTLKEGDWFGEIALVQNTLRTATLTSITPCLLLYLSKARFIAFLDQLAPELRQRLIDSIISRRTANSLKAIPLFSFLSRMENGTRTFDEQKLQLLGEMFTFEDYRSNHVVFEEGDKADAFYIIQKGTVGVYARKGANDDELMEKSRQEERNRKGATGRRLRGAAVDDEDEDEDEDSSSAHTEDDDSDSGCSCSDGSPKHGPLPSPSASTPASAAAHSSSPSGASSVTARSAGILLNELTKNDWYTAQTRRQAADIREQRASIPSQRSSAHLSRSSLVRAPLCVCVLWC